MFSNSFAWYVINLAISAFWLVVAVATEQWLFAIGTVIFIGIAVVFDLPDSSSDDGADDPSV